MLQKKYRIKKVNEEMLQKNYRIKKKLMKKCYKRSTEFKKS